MRIRSKLADVEFEFGEIARDGNLLVITSHPDARMKSRVYVSPQDVAALFGRMIMSPSALVFVIGLPFFYFRAARANKNKQREGR
jgi:hypothetical protein